LSLLRGAVAAPAVSNCQLSFYQAPRKRSLAAPAVSNCQQSFYQAPRERSLNRSVSHHSTAHHRGDKLQVWGLGNCVACHVGTKRRPIWSSRESSSMADAAKPDPSLLICSLQFQSDQSGAWIWTFGEFGRSPAMSGGPAKAF
jgi:hypothetical protein